MLVIVSDLHLTDGSVGGTVSPGAFAIFAERLKDLAVAASWRADGSYQPIEGIDVVLLGDILDVIRSSQWNNHSSIRPWGNPHAPEFVDQVSRITNDILLRNTESLAMLRNLSSEGGVTIPPVIHGMGKPAYDAEGEPVPVRIHYMVGNHDWFFHLPGKSYNTLRQSVVRNMGLANPTDQPFPHDIVENGELLQIMRRHKVMARHGDLHDPFNFEGDRDTSSLGDVIVVELINRFVAEIEQQMGEELPISTILGIREIDNVRPLLLVPVWIDGVLERTCSFPSLRKRVKTIWDNLAEEFLAIDFVRHRDSWSPFDLVDGLEKALRFSRRLSIGWASFIANWMNEVRGCKSPSYFHHALAEQDFRNRRARHIVYGHTHVSESIPLDASYAEGYVLNQCYFNAGTWRRVHQQTQWALTEHEFVAHDVFTYLAFFQGDERSGRPYETWSGTLGYNPAETTIHRIDTGRVSHAPHQSVSSPSLHDHAPHFSTSASRSRRLSSR